MYDLITAPAGAVAPVCAAFTRAPSVDPSGRVEALPGHPVPNLGDVDPDALLGSSAIPPEGEADHNGDARERPDFPHGGMSDNSCSWTPDRADAGAPLPVIIGHSAGASELPAEPASDPLDDMAAEFAAASKSEATRRAYRSDLRNFGAWCKADGACGLPATPRTVTRYVTHLAGLGRSVSTIDRRAAAISYAHRLAGLDAPSATEEVRAVLTGIRNTIGRRPMKKKALTADLVGKVVKKIPSDLAGLRDRAMILLCFGAALRRSELVALDVANLEPHRRGLLVRLGRSKTDQAGEGRSVAVPNGKLKAPDAVAAWLAASGITAGPLFRGCDRGKLSAERLSDRQFARVLKKRCAAIGLDPDLIGGHSPRRGFATSAGDAGADLRHTARHMRHAKLETTLGYMEDGDLFRESAGKGFM
ncbi:integrase [Lichenibacterium minor]|uniref:Integrase n=2 Tax=Lichenibacterium minor TaxID=2316528 RepID=A0A4V1RU11_9HYPH|nr:integrase [Lichenibacterium minor]